MTEERWSRTRRIYQEALDLPEAERGDYLLTACGDDSELLAEVTGLLKVDVDEAFLSTPPVETGVSLGDFELRSEIGSGGTGIVYRAWQRSLSREVAVKVLPRHFSLNEERVGRFKREARAAAKLTHNCIAPIFEIGMDGDTHFFAMELVEGLDLASEVKALRGREASTLPSFDDKQYFAGVARLVQRCAGALAYSHGKGVVHRDIKPHNIVVDQDGMPKLVDFGLAKDSALGSISVSERVEGTPYYMSPEQALAKKGRVDARTDVYSLGAVLYELLTLDRPYQGNTSREVIDKILVRDPVPVRKRNPKVPRDLAVICTKAMEKDLRFRYESAAAMEEDLRRFLAGEPILAKPASVLRRAQRAAKKHRLTLGAAAAVLLTAGVFMYAVKWKEQQDWIPIQISLLEDERSADPTGVELWAIPLDPTGTPIDREPRALGALPVQASLEMRYWMIQARRGSDLLAEFAVTLTEGDELFERGIYLRDDVIVDAPTVLVTGQEWDATGICDQLPRLTVIGDLEVDVTEVTYGQYLNFCDATERAYPYPLAQGWASEVPMDFPVSGINRLDAQCFANWAGKRLPTHHELDYLMEGPEGRLYPWGNEVPTTQHRAQIIPELKDVGNNERPMFDYVMENMNPVGSFPVGASPHGILDFSGSLIAYTSSPGITLGSEKQVIWTGMIMTMGRAFVMGPYFLENTSFDHVARPDAENWHPVDIGFRCVRTVSVP
jgi:formylglycine-generating enzyme required for sulfatase activity